MISLPLIDPPCNDCTALCCKARGHKCSVEMEPEEADLFPEAIWDESGGIGDGAWGLPIKNGKCIFLGSDDRCTIYERRPLLCRQFNCVSGYKSKDGEHSFFLEDHPELVEIIEAKLK